MSSRRNINTQGYWLRVIDTNPERVVALLDWMWPAQRGTRTRFGDDSEGFEKVLGALSTCAAAETGTRWHRLLNVGITKALCGCLWRCPEAGESYQDDQALTSTYWPFVSILWQGGQNLEHLPGPANARFVSELKDSWTKIIIRLFYDPQRSLRPYLTSVEERQSVAQLVKGIVDYDETFISIVHDPDDLTVSLLTRYLIHSTELEDSLDCLVALDFVLRREASDFLQRMLLGVQNGSPSTLLSSLARLLPTRPATLQLLLSNFIFGLSMLPRWCEGRLEQEFLHTLLRSKALLCYFCDIVARSDEADTTSCRGFNTDLLVAPALGFIGQCLFQAGAESPQEMVVFVKGLLRAGIFDALEAVLLQKSDKIADVPCLVATILGKIYSASRASPSLLSSLRRQFPRPLLVRACLDLPYTSNKVLYEWVRAHPKSPSVSDILSAWIVADGLCWTSHMDGTCMRRGCGRKRRKRCAACGTVEYCGVECQAEDWAEHRMLCGFKDGRLRRALHSSSDDKRVDYISPPERFPFRFPEIDPAIFSPPECNE